MIQTYRLKIDVPDVATIGDYRERVEALRGIGYPHESKELKHVTLDLTVEAEDCFNLGRAFAAMVLEVEGLLTPYGWQMPDPEHWQSA